MADNFLLQIYDVEHGACAILESPDRERIAMIDSGHNGTTGWRPSIHIRYGMRRQRLDYFLNTNADQDHLSDLAGLDLHDVYIGTFHRNRSIPVAVLRAIKEQSGDLTNDVDRYLELHRDWVHPVAVPFDQGMGGVTLSTFWNSYPAFTDTNNLSMAVFIKYAGFKILFPGDLEQAGWLALLQNPAFVAELRGTVILVASHHGRLSGFCAEIFDYFTPWAVVISDKPIAHETQDLDYSPYIRRDGVVLTNSTRRHVLTTRRDGDITFSVDANGDFRIITEKAAARVAA